MAAALPFIAVAAAVGGTAYQVSESNKAKKRAEEEARRQREEQARLLQEQRDEANKLQEQLQQEQKEVDRASGTDAEDSPARRRQRQASTAGVGRGDTILTGSLGVSQQATTANKTLLGA